MYYTRGMGYLVDSEIPDTLNRALCQINWYPKSDFTLHSLLGLSHPLPCVFLLKKKKKTLCDACIFCLLENDFYVQKLVDNFDAWVVGGNFYSLKQGHSVRTPGLTLLLLTTTDTAESRALLGEQMHPCC